jgi:glutamine synthetase
MIFDKYQSEECLISFDQQYYMENARPSQSRILAERHLEYCNQIGIKISGMNKLLSPDQWSYQLEATNPVDACDDLWMSRFILLRLSERHDINVDFKVSENPLQNNHCFINFSLRQTRCGLSLIKLYMHRLKATHASFVSLSGIPDQDFIWSEGDKNSSVRIINNIIENKVGSFEDRRPLGNVDPYAYCALLVEVCCSN